MAANPKHGNSLYWMIQLFPVTKITTIVRWVCHLIYCPLSVKINMWKSVRCIRLVHACARRSWVHYVCVCFARKDLDTPTGDKWMAMSLHSKSGISLLYLQTFNIWNKYSYLPLTSLDLAISFYPKQWKLTLNKGEKNE